ncbi:MAG: carbohydrate kinase [endosymbiont of Galathealinum brachiosum]|uniref:Carbohydrate kinase n=1 Tax=endosymbiont of Galathealinum brachiosum TaxID=2200906 RepID=A0A370DHL6_9GAMM|nr:MAG: carbohydrate kinase [endosymbiont of Galathealinum brachiosum]
MTKINALHIGIDLGTSGVRACVINNNKALLHTCKTPIPSPIRQGNAITQDANLWWHATNKVLRDLFSKINVKNVKAISVNGTSGTVLLCDEQGKPVAPARMYNDGFCTEQAALIKSIAPAETAAHGTSSGLAKLLYLQPLYPQARHLLHQADWIVGKLCGRFDISDENNALKTGYDPQASKWPDWLNDLNVNMDLLPEVVAPGTCIAHVSKSLFGLNADCQIVSGTTDSIAAFIATGANKPGDAVTSLGSTLVLKVVSDKPVTALEFGIYSHKLGDYWLAGGASNSGGAVLERYFDSAQINQLSDSLKPEEPTGFDYYPLLQAGERFPVNDAQLQPRLEPKADTELKFFQAILEGISRIELDGYNKLHKLGAPFPLQVETTGGGSKNKAWCQIRELALGVEVKQAEYSEACYGSALLARAGFNNS